MLKDDRPLSMRPFGAHPYWTPPTQARSVKLESVAALIDNCLSTIAVMKRNLSNAESDWQRRCESEGYVDPPERLAVVRERITEARRMLNALNARFPRAE
jgi:hypothetical protein